MSSCVLNLSPGEGTQRVETYFLIKANQSWMSWQFHRRPDSVPDRRRHFVAPGGATMDRGRVRPARCPIVRLSRNRSTMFRSRCCDGLCKPSGSRATVVSVKMRKIMNLCRRENSRISTISQCCSWGISFRVSTKQDFQETFSRAKHFLFVFPPCKLFQHFPKSGKFSKRKICLDHREYFFFFSPLWLNFRDWNFD